jgi:hypothetical protein
VVASGLGEDQFLLRVGRHAGHKQNEILSPYWPHLVPLTRDDDHYITRTNVACLTINANAALPSDHIVHFLSLGVVVLPAGRARRVADLGKAVPREVRDRRTSQFTNEGSVFPDVRLDRSATTHMHTDIPLSSSPAIVTQGRAQSKS